MKINYDAELLERARWIVEHGVDKPAKHEIERRPFLELPLPIYRKGRSTMKKRGASQAAHATAAATKLVYPKVDVA